MNNCSHLDVACCEYSPCASRGVGLSFWGGAEGMGFVWGTLNCRTREQDGAGQSNSLNSGWSGGAAELVVPAVGKAL